MSLKGKPTSPAPSPLLKNATAAPIIYFDSAPAAGIYANNFEIELACRVLMPSRDGVNVTADQVCVGHLRCSPAAAQSLIDIASKMLANLNQAGERASAEKLDS